MELEPAHLPENERVGDIATRFNTIADKLIITVASTARTPGENERSLAEKNVDFALSRVAHALKGGSDVTELLKQLEQTTIVDGNHIPEADILFDEIKEVAHDYLRAIRE